MGIEISYDLSIVSTSYMSYPARGMGIEIIAFDDSFVGFAVIPREGYGD